MKKKMIFLQNLICILLIFCMFFSATNQVEAGEHFAVSNFGPIGRSQAVNNYSDEYSKALKSFVIPAESFSRVYYARILGSRSNADGTVNHLLVSGKTVANKQNTFTFANIRRSGSWDGNENDSSNRSAGIGVLGLNGNVILEMGYKDNAVGGDPTSNGSNIFRVWDRVGVKDPWGWQGNSKNSGNEVYTKYNSSQMTSANYGVYNSTYTTLENSSNVTRSNYDWPDHWHRPAVYLYFDEEGPTTTLSYNDATNVLTAKATDQTTDPVPAAGVKYYSWANGSASTSVTVANSITQTTTITSSGTKYFTAKDAYDNLGATKSAVFYKYTFNYNYSGASEPYFTDYKMKGQNLPVPTAPTRTGHKFKGWSTDASATSGSTSAFTTESNTTLYATWEATYELVAKPTLSGTYTYNGSQQTATLSGFDSAKMTVSGNKQTAAGTYTITVKLSDTSKYHWADDSTGNLSISWTINKKALTITASAQTVTYGTAITKNVNQITSSGLVSRT